MVKSLPHKHSNHLHQLSVDEYIYVKFPGKKHKLCDGCTSVLVHFHCLSVVDMKFKLQLKLYF